MDMPQNLRYAIEEKAAEYKQDELKAAAARVSLKYRSESGEGRRLVTSRLDSLVYAVSRMPATYAALTAALTYARETYEGDISSHIDVGSGTGAAAWASDAVFSPEKITLIERENEMLKLGKELADIDSAPTAEWISADITGDLPSAHADLVTASYVMNEMKESDREKLLLKLWSITDKLLIIVEPGTPEGFRQLSSARKTLLSAEACICAPCSHCRECPLPADDWCHFTVRVQRSKLHKLLKGGDAPYEDEKFSYMVFSRDNSRTASARILRHPLTEKGKITLKLCTEDGIITRTVGKSDRAYKAARKACSGDSIDL